MRVLIIEDQPAIAMVLEGLVSDEGHEAIVRADGLSGLERLSQAPLPDLALVDLFMPGMSGRDVVEVARSRPGLADLPIVLITGAVPSAGVFPPKNSYQAFIRKPFDVQQVLETIKRLTVDRLAPRR